MSHATPAWWRSPWCLATALYVGVTLAYARPLLPLLSSALPNDTGDPGLNTWIIWWNAHAIPLTTRWWNGPIFFPAQGATALSETFLNLVPVSTPLQWAGLSAVLTYNILFLLSFPTAALAAHGLARRLTGRHDAALIAGLAFGFAPYRAAQMPHLQMLWSCWMPLGLLALHAYQADRKARHLVLFGVSWLMNGLSTGYYLFFFCALFGLWMLWYARTRRDLLTIGIAVLVATLPLAPLLLGYQHYQTAYGLSRTMQEIESFSADLNAIWATAPQVWPHVWTIEPGPEGELYPGATILALTLAGAVVVWRRAKPDRQYRAQPFLAIGAIVLALMTYASAVAGWSAKLARTRISLTQPGILVTLCVLAIAMFWNPRFVQAWRRRSPFLFYAIASLLMLLFALGPVGHVAKVVFLDPAPYYWLMQLPGGHAFRVPARFAMLFVLCLAEAAALAYANLTATGRLKRRPAMAAAVCVAVGLEGFVANMAVAKIPAPIDLAGLDRGAVILDLPLVDDFSDTAALLRATQSGHTLVNGFSGYAPPHYNLLREGLAAFDQSVLRTLQRFGPLLVFVHEDADPEQRYRDFVGDLPDAHRVLKISAGSLFQLPGRPAARLTADRQLPIAAIRTNIGELQASEMTDGDLTTRWVAQSRQSAGHQVTVTLDRPADLSRLELDLGELRDAYPRKFRVSVEDPGQPPVTVWEGQTTGVAMVAALTDRARMPLVFDLVPVTRGRRLVLTVLDSHPELSWAIAELKVFGR